MSSKAVKGQLNLFPERFIKDADCTKDTPVTLGKQDAPVYGQGIRIKPREPGRTDSEHFKKIYLCISRGYRSHKKTNNGRIWGK